MLFDFLPVVGLIVSQVQCTLFITWCPASLWQARQTLVTFRPGLERALQFLNLLWSASARRLAAGRSHRKIALRWVACRTCHHAGVARIKAPPIQRRQSNVFLPIPRSSAGTTLNPGWARNLSYIYESADHRIAPFTRLDRTCSTESSTPVRMPETCARPRDLRPRTMPTPQQPPRTPRGTPAPARAAPDCPRRQLPQALSRIAGTRPTTCPSLRANRPPPAATTPSASATATSSTRLADGRTRPPRPRSSATSDSLQAGQNRRPRNELTATLRQWEARQTGWTPRAQARGPRPRAGAADPAALDLPPPGLLKKLDAGDDKRRQLTVEGV